MLSENIEDRMTFSFSLYTIPLQVVLVIYLRLRNRNLEDEKPLEGGKVCCCQHWKKSASFN